MLSDTPNKFGELPDEAREYIAQTGLIPRYKYWAKMAHWSAEEAIALSLDVDPTIMNTTNIPERIMILIAKEYREVKELVNRAVRAYKLHTLIRPEKYLEWAKFHDVNIPERLESLIPLSTTTQKLAQKSEEKPLGTRERDTLLKIIIGMAIDKYHYDPKAIKGSAVTKIKDGLERAGFKITDDTIRDKLQEAKKYLSPEYSDS